MNKDLNKSVIYEIYPTSYFDSNGDGIGDLNGITEKLDYVKELGADIVWINPFYQSPFKDGGYDISDYYKVDKKFGTLDDFDRLIEKARSLGLRVLVDLVVGHTSDKHEWFKQSKKPKRNEYSDWYVWTDNIFTGVYNAVNGMAKRNGNYIVNYYSFQPALNYGWLTAGENGDNPYAGSSWKMHYKDERLVPLRNEIKNIILFWLGRGADGFRVDLTASLIKGGRELEALSWLWGDLIGAAKAKFPNSIFMAEWGRPELSTKCGFDIDYLNHESRGYNLTFRADKGSNILPAFECGKSYFSESGEGNKSELLEYTKELYECMEKGKYYAIPSGYHDMVRIAASKDEDMLKCIFAFLLTYRNLPMIYYGDEIGITHNFAVNKDGGYVRTGARTPMQWTEGENRGFSTAKKLYLPVGKKKGVSVEYQEKDESSIYSTVKKLIAIKKKYEQLDYDAELEIIDGGEYPLVYLRKKNGKTLFVAINPSNEEYVYDYQLKEILAVQNATAKDKVSLKAKGYIIGRI